MIGDWDNAIDQTDPERIRQKTSSQSLDAVRPRTPAGEDRARCRFNCDHLNSGFMSSQALSNARQGASRANSDHDDVNRATRFFPDFKSSAFAMSTRVGLVVKLLRIPGIGQGGTQFHDFIDSATHPLASRRQNNLGPKALQEETTLQPDGIGHSEDTMIATGSSYPGQRNPHIAAGRLDNGAVLMQQSLRFRLADHLERDAIF